MNGGCFNAGRFMSMDGWHEVRSWWRGEDFLWNGALVEVAKHSRCVQLAAGGHGQCKEDLPLMNIPLHTCGHADTGLRVGAQASSTTIAYLRGEVQHPETNLSNCIDYPGYLVQPPPRTKLALSRAHHHRHYSAVDVSQPTPPRRQISGCTLTKLLRCSCSRAW